MKEHYLWSFRQWWTFALISIKEHYKVLFLCRQLDLLLSIRSWIFSSSWLTFISVSWSCERPQQRAVYCKCEVVYSNSLTLWQMVSIDVLFSFHRLLPQWWLHQSWCQAGQAVRELRTRTAARSVWITEGQKGQGSGLLSRFASSNIKHLKMIIMLH